MFENIAYFITLLSVAVSFGGMVFFSGVMAPLIFIKLPSETAGAFIRQVFPFYYLSIGIVSAIALLASFASGLGWLSIVRLLLVVAGFVVARQFMMPLINQYRDAGKAGDEEAKKQFQRWHGMSVWLNAAQMLILLVVLMRLGIL